MADHETPKFNDREHPVLQELERRLRGESPQYRLALGIEGGGIRGVISAGMLSAMAALGIRPEHFDVIFASSAGSFNAAYYLGGRDAIRTGPTIYYEDNGPEFIDIRRIRNKTKPILDLDYVLNKVMEQKKPLNLDEVVAAQKLRPIATEVESAKRHAFEPPTSISELKLQLRASATIPLVAGQPTEVLGKKYIDGGMTEAVPFETPIENGYDAILILSTLPLTEILRKGIASRLGEKIVQRQVTRINPELGGLMAVRNAQKVKKIRRLIEMTNNPECPPFVFAIAPNASDPTVSRLETASPPIIQGAKVGYLATKNAFGLKSSGRFHTEGRFEEI